MHRSFVVVTALVAATLGFAPLAAADITVAIVELPAGPIEIDAGTTHNLAFQVKATLQNTVCAPTPPATQAILRIAVTATSALAGVVVNVTTAEVSLEVTGAHTQAAPFSKQGASAVDVTAADDAPSGNGTVEVTAAVASGGNPCQPAGTATTGAASTNITVIGAPEEEPDDGGDGDDGDAGAGNNTTKKKKDGGIPGVESPLVLVTLALAAFLVARRRRDE